MTPRSLCALFAIAILLTSAAAAAEDFGAGAETPDQFIARHGLVAWPLPRPDALPPGSIFDFQAAPRLEIAEANNARFGASALAMRDLFRARAAAARKVPTPEEVRRAIDETFGVSRLGEGFELAGTRHILTDSRGTLTDISFRFGEGGFGEAIVGVPAHPNGHLVIALHGCTSSPDGVMRNVHSYANSFGLSALEQGYTVVAPYVLSQCAWIHNLDWLGSMSGISVFGYELAKLREVTAWAQRTYAIRNTVIWGISLGGQYSMLAAALYPNLYDVAIIAGSAADYEGAYLGVFDSVGVDANNRIGDNRQVALSARFRRADIFEAIAPRPVIFEIPLQELTPGAIAFVNRAEEIARAKQSAAPRVVLYNGLHETNPTVTLRVLSEVLAGLGGRRVRPSGAR